MKKNFLYLLLFPLLCFCHNQNGSGSTEPQISISTKNTIAQNEVGNACLNIAQFGVEFHLLDPRLQIKRVSKNVSITPLGLSPNFTMESIFSSFHFDSQEMSEFIDFDGFSQTDCKTLIYSSVDGSEDEYQITQSSPNSITANSPDGKSLQYTWLSPQSVELTKRYRIFNNPCSSASGFAELTLIYDWSGAFPALISADSPFSIDPNYLSILATAANISVSSLYQDQTVGGSLVTASLENLASSPIRPDYLNCDVPPDPNIP